MKYDWNISRRLYQPRIPRDQTSSELFTIVPEHQTTQNVLIRRHRSLARHRRRSHPVPSITQATLTHSLGQFEFLRQLSNNPANTVIGMVRDVKSTEAKVKEEINRSNIHLIHGDLDSYELLKAGHRHPSQEILLIGLQRKQAKPPRKSQAEASTILSPTGLVFPKTPTSSAL